MVPRCRGSCKVCLYWVRVLVSRGGRRRDFGQPGPESRTGRSESKPVFGERWVTVLLEREVTSRGDSAFGPVPRPEGRAHGWADPKTRVQFFQQKDPSTSVSGSSLRSIGVRTSTFRFLQLPRKEFIKNSWIFLQHFTVCLKIVVRLDPALRPRR